MHGKMPAGLREFVKNNSIDMIISMGDHADADERRNLIFKNWGFFKNKNNYYKAFESLIGKNKCRALHKRYALSGKGLLQKLDSIGVPVLILHGNNDFTERDRAESGYNFPTLEKTVKSSKNLKLFDGEKFNIGLYTLIGIGGYREISRSGRLEPSQKEKCLRLDRNFRKRMEKVLDNLDQRKTILIGHDQPRKTIFDKVNFKQSPAHGKSVGDEIIRECIDKFHPAAYIGGHMHEHHGISKLGDTALVAAGYGREGQCVMLEFPSLKIGKVVL